MKINMFTKQHYEAIAEIINHVSDNGYGYIDPDTLVKELCVYFKNDNPRFDSYRFKKACIGK